MTQSLKKRTEVASSSLLTVRGRLSKEVGGEARANSPFLLVLAGVASLKGIPRPNLLNQRPGTERRQEGTEEYCVDYTHGPPSTVSIIHGVHPLNCT